MKLDKTKLTRWMPLCWCRLRPMATSGTERIRTRRSTALCLRNWFDIDEKKLIVIRVNNHANGPDTMSATTKQFLVGHLVNENRSHVQHSTNTQFVGDNHRHQPMEKTWNRRFFAGRP